MGEEAAHILEPQSTVEGGAKERGKKKKGERGERWAEEGAGSMLVSDSWGERGKKRRKK